MSKICQSCAFPMDDDSFLGTNSDGSINHDYCKYCYSKGKFVQDMTMNEFVEFCAQFGEQAGMTDEQMREYCSKVFPTLKRWKNN